MNILAAKTGLDEFKKRKKKNRKAHKDGWIWGQLKEGVNMTKRFYTKRSRY